MIRRPPRSPLFPSTPLFRSLSPVKRIGGVDRQSQSRHFFPFGTASAGCRAQLVRGRLERSCVLAICVNLEDRKSTRLNSSHSQISYAVFCLKKKKIKQHETDGVHHLDEVEPSEPRDRR